VWLDSRLQLHHGMSNFLPQCNCVAAFTMRRGMVGIVTKLFLVASVSIVSGAIAGMGPAVDPASFNGPLAAVLPVNWSAPLFPHDTFTGKITTTSNPATTQTQFLTNSRFIVALSPGSQVGAVVLIDADTGSVTYTVQDFPGCSVSFISAIPELPRAFVAGCSYTVSAYQADVTGTNVTQLWSVSTAANTQFSRSVMVSRADAESATTTFVWIDTTTFATPAVYQHTRVLLASNGTELWRAKIGGDTTGQPLPVVSCAGNGLWCAVFRMPRTLELIAVTTGASLLSQEINAIPSMDPDTFYVAVPNSANVVEENGFNVVVWTWMITAAFRIRRGHDGTYGIAGDYVTMNHVEDPIVGVLVLPPSMSGAVLYVNSNATMYNVTGVDLTQYGPAVRLVAATTPGYDGILPVSGVAVSVTADLIFQVIIKLTATKPQTPPASGYLPTVVSLTGHTALGHPEFLGDVAWNTTVLGNSNVADSCVGFPFALVGGYVPICAGVTLNTKSLPSLALIDTIFGSLAYAMQAPEDPYVATTTHITRGALADPVTGRIMATTFTTVAAFSLQLGATQFNGITGGGPSDTVQQMVTANVDSAGANAVTQRLYAASRGANPALAYLSILEYTLPASATESVTVQQLPEQLPLNLSSVNGARTYVNRVTGRTKVLVNGECDPSQWADMACLVFIDAATVTVDYVIRFNQDSMVAYDIIFGPLANVVAVIGTQATTVYSTTNFRSLVSFAGQSIYTISFDSDHAYIAEATTVTAMSIPNFENVWATALQGPAKTSVPNIDTTEIVMNVTGGEICRPIAFCDTNARFVAVDRDTGKVCFEAPLACSGNVFTFRSQYFVPADIPDGDHGTKSVLVRFDLNDHANDAEIDLAPIVFLGSGFQQVTADGLGVYVFLGSWVAVVDLIQGRLLWQELQDTWTISKMTLSQDGRIVYLNYLDGSMDSILSARNVFDGSELFQVPSAVWSVPTVVLRSPTSATKCATFVNTVGTANGVALYPCVGTAPVALPPGFNPGAPPFTPNATLAPFTQTPATAAPGGHNVDDGGDSDDDTNRAIAIGVGVAAGVVVLLVGGALAMRHFAQRRRAEYASVEEEGRMI
jgi:hypothetical protein